LHSEKEFVGKNVYRLSYRL